MQNKLGQLPLQGPICFLTNACRHVVLACGEKSHNATDDCPSLNIPGLRSPTSLQPLFSFDSQHKDVPRIHAFEVTF